MYKSITMVIHTTTGVLQPRTKSKLHQLGTSSQANSTTKTIALIR